MERIVPYEKRRNYLCQDFNRHRCFGTDGADSDFRCRERTVSAHCKRYQRQYTAIKQCRCRNLQPLFL